MWDGRFSEFYHRVAFCTTFSLWESLTNRNAREHRLLCLHFQLVRDCDGNEIAKNPWEARLQQADIFACWQHGVCSGRRGYGVMMTFYGCMFEQRCSVRRTNPALHADPPLGFSISALSDGILESELVKRACPNKTKPVLLLQVIKSAGNEHATTTTAAVGCLSPQFMSDPLS